MTTKLPPDHADRERRTLPESLTKLGVDFVDRWLVHWPARRPSGAENVGAVHRCSAGQSGQGHRVSNYALDQIDELTAATGVTPSVNQIRWSPALYDRGVASGLEQRGVVLEGYGPLKRSNLDDPTLVSIAGEHEATTAQVIVDWHVAHGFAVIPKSVRPERIVANAAGARQADSRRGDGHRQAFRRGHGLEPLHRSGNGGCDGV